MDNIVKVPLKFCYLNDSSGNDDDYNYKHYFLASAIVSISAFQIGVPVNSISISEFSTSSNQNRERLQTQNRFSPFILNSRITGFRADTATTLASKKVVEISERQMSRNTKFALGSVGSLKTHNSSAQPFSTTEESIVAIRNKPTVFEKNVGKAVNNKVATVRGKSKRRISDNQYADIVHRAMQIEKTLGCQPGLLDFLCYGLTTDEVNVAWDVLQWLFPDFDKKGAVISEPEVEMEMGSKMVISA